jgi:hypothetical protein
MEEKERIIIGSKEEKLNGQRKWNASDWSGKSTTDWQEEMVCITLKRSNALNGIWVKKYVTGEEVMHTIEKNYILSA